MAKVSRKTEIQPLDGTPEKRLFWSIISDYDLSTALTELADNAFDIWLSGRSTQVLSIVAELDVEQQWITIKDDAGGVPKQNLRLLVAPGGSANSAEEESIGIFGVGSKRAVVAVAESATIKTRFGLEDSFQIDISDDWLESGDWEIAAYQIPDIDARSTSVELYKLRKPFAAEFVEQLRARFGETYGRMLKGQVEIQVNGKPVAPITFESWAFPPEHAPRRVEFEVVSPGEGVVRVEITAGLIRDRDPVDENYGVYIYCNERLIVRALKAREVGYYSSAGVPHPDASLCRVIVRLNGPAKMMPWNSSKTGVNYSHKVFQNIRPVIEQLLGHFSSLSRRLKSSWESEVFSHGTGEVVPIAGANQDSGRRLSLPQLPRVQKSRVESAKARNIGVLTQKPWTLGLLEAVEFVDVIRRQRLETSSRISMILLDSTFEIALKEFIVHRQDLFPSSVYNDAKIAEVFKNRHKVIQTIIDVAPIDPRLLERARHYYNVRNKLIHERATVAVPEVDVDNYRDVIQSILSELFGLEF
jgi:hypothetical protein